MICKHCGQSLPNDAKVCHNCSTPVRSPFSVSSGFSFAGNLTDEKPAPMESYTHTSKYGTPEPQPADPPAVKPYQGACMEIGIDQKNGLPFTMNLCSAGVITVAGWRRGQIRNFLQRLIVNGHRNYPDKTAFYVIDDSSRRLLSTAAMPNVKEYIHDSEDALRFIKQLELMALARKQAVQTSDPDLLTEAAVLVLVLYGQETINALRFSQSAGSAFENLLQICQENHICIILCPQTIPQDEKEYHKLIFFDDPQQVDLPPEKSGEVLTYYYLDRDLTLRLRPE